MRRGVTRVFLTVLLCAFPVTGAYASSYMLSNVPDYAWDVGCTPTAATMLMGYYDINGYGGNSYDNLIPGGTAPLSTFTSDGDHLQNNTIVHSATENMATDMGTDSQGSTLIAYDGNGGKYTVGDLTYGATYGLWQYVQDAGYGISKDAVYSQLTDNSSQNGFTFTDLEDEINAGRPVILQMNNLSTGIGHSMLAYGYDDTNGMDEIYFQNTWSANGVAYPNIMDWTGSWEDGMTLYGVTCLTLSNGDPAPAPTPEPGTLLLFSCGLIGLTGVTAKRRLKKI